MIPRIGVLVEDFINCTDPLVMDQSRRGVPRKYYKSPDASLVIKPGGYSKEQRLIPLP